MAHDPIHLVRAYLRQHKLPLQVWLAPMAHRQLAAPLRETLPASAHLLEVPTEPQPSGPAILMATAADIRGPHRGALMQLQQAALPGRPIICGGTANREVLLDAINNWQVFHLLPSKPSSDELTGSVTRAQRACALEHAAILCAVHLRTRCDEVQRVLQEIEATREQIIQAERLTTVSGFSRALTARLGEHIERLRGLETALGTLPDDPRRAELLEFTVHSTHSIEALLADLLDKAAAAQSPPSVERGPANPAAEALHGRHEQ